MSMSYKKANTILLVLIIVINLYVIAAPFIPHISWWWQRNHTDTRQQVVAAAAAKPDKPVPNHLVIPDMLLNKQVYEGTIAQTYPTLRKGIWHWPGASSPDKGGNTVLVGHRFTYTNPRGVFYDLDKVKLGSTITLFWDNVKYEYKVDKIKVVPETDVSVQAPSSDTRLTIYTCTPLWHPVNRLVVIAHPIQEEPS